ncbi:MAG TPA: thymidine phosphorylase family protein [Gemmatimonadales bacterium]
MTSAAPSRVLPGAPVAVVHRARRLGIDTGHTAVVYLHRGSEIVRSEGLDSETRVVVSAGGHTLLATLGVVSGDLLRPDEAGLSEAAWDRLAIPPDAPVSVGHAPPLDSLRHVRAKIHGLRLDRAAMDAVVQDVAAGRYTDIHIASFLTACAGERLDRREMIDLTTAMVAAGVRLTWPSRPVMDKHSVGGLPGNRTTPVVVGLAPAAGLLMPKTSSRAITSPAGTADTMAVLTCVELDAEAMRRVVEREGGCIVWGGAARLSPADDVLIRVERPLDLDASGQLVASVLSKKAAAGATHVLLDLPVGPTAKIRSLADAERLAGQVRDVGRAVGLEVMPLVTDGTQPVGRGVGPALEARDVLAVLRCEAGAPEDLRDRALLLAGCVLEMSGAVPAGCGHAEARSILDGGRARRKFEAICRAQGGLREPPTAGFRREVPAPHGGRVGAIDNRRLARVAKLAGAPADPAAGLELHVRLGQTVEAGAPLFTVHAESAGELEYALGYARQQSEIITLAEPS